jgi:hypothetical protein
MTPRLVNAIDRPGARCSAHSHKLATLTLTALSYIQIKPTGSMA